MCVYINGVCHGHDLQDCVMRPVSFFSSAKVSSKCEGEASEKETRSLYETSFVAYA